MCAGSSARRSWQSLPLPEMVETKIACRIAPAIPRAERPQTRQQLPRCKRLDEIVVGVGLGPFHARLFARPRRQQDDWCAGED